MKTAHFPSSMMTGGQLPVVIDLVQLQRSFSGTVAMSYCDLPRQTVLWYLYLPLHTILI